VQILAQRRTINGRTSTYVPIFIEIKQKWTVLLSRDSHEVTISCNNLLQ